MKKPNLGSEERQEGRLRHRQPRGHGHTGDLAGRLRVQGWRQQRRGHWFAEQGYHHLVDRFGDLRPMPVQGLPVID